MHQQQGGGCQRQALGFLCKMRIHDEIGGLDKGEGFQQQEGTPRIVFLSKCLERHRYDYFIEEGDVNAVSFPSA